MTDPTTQAGKAIAFARDLLIQCLSLSPNADFIHALDDAINEAEAADAARAGIPLTVAGYEEHIDRLIDERTKAQDERDTLAARLTQAQAWEGAAKSRANTLAAENAALREALTPLFREACSEPGTCERDSHVAAHAALANHAAAQEWEEKWRAETLRQVADARDEGYQAGYDAAYIEPALYLDLRSPDAEQRLYDALPHGLEGRRAIAQHTLHAMLAVSKIEQQAAMQGEGSKDA